MDYRLSRAAERERERGQWQAIRGSDFVRRYNGSRTYIPNDKCVRVRVCGGSVLCGTYTAKFCGEKGQLRSTDRLRFSFDRTSARVRF